MKCRIEVRNREVVLDVLTRTAYVEERPNGYEQLVCRYGGLIHSVQSEDEVNRVGRVVNTLFINVDKVDLGRDI